MKKPTSTRWPAVPNKHWGFAQEMRKEPTHAEHILWQTIRRAKLGVRFRRQHPCGPFIADFACIECKLVVEVDGDVHDHEAQTERDRAKEEYLIERGFHVLRFRNEEVLFELDRVVRAIETVVRTAKPDPH